MDPNTLPHATGVFNLVAFLAIAAVTAILVIGIKESANFNSFIVIIKVCVLLVFIGLGVNYIIGHMSPSPRQLDPFVPPNKGSFGEFGWSGVVRAAGVIFFAYIGFDAVSTAAQEAKNPKRTCRIGILGSLVICTILYILVAGVLTGLVKYDTLNVPDPIAIGIDHTGVRWGSFLVKLGAICGLGSTMVVMLLGQSRVFFSMSKDGLLPEWFSAIHPKFRTPWISSIFVGLFVAIFASVIPIAILGELVSIGTLLAFVIVSRGRLGDSPHRSRSAAPLQDALGAVRPHHGNANLASHDARTATRYLDPPDRLADHRHVHLFLLWTQSQPRPEPEADAPGQAGRHHGRLIGACSEELVASGC